MPTQTPSGFVYAYADGLGSEHVRSTGEKGTNWPFGEFPVFQNGVSPDHFTGKPYDSETGLDYFGARYYAPALGRFMTPDPLGGHLADPQSLDKYAYVANDPSSLTDPSGLDFYLTCGKRSSSCQKDRDGDLVQGSTVNGTFEATQLTEQRNGGYTDQFGKSYTGTFSQSGISFTPSSGGSSGAVFDRGTATDTLAGSGLFKGFGGRFNDNCGGTCVASGSISGTAAQFTGLFSRMMQNPGLDVVDLFHVGATNYRYGNPTGPDPHVVDRPTSRLAGWDQFHFDGSYPYGGLWGFLSHAASALTSLVHLVTGPQELPPRATIPH